ncbi:BT4734/BF3469 family protein [Adhaeribacter rhizoryzae]|uniref:BT4734-like N-terminal domain-containing protein n=1 Tax=Adhaeribacter rhizoryzae TaxID=2607907 RepID=A0A5M6DLG1_9BACT|nr:BT4734/BF3469 family protein [Adhaeribacter rhizoryzae]KAA5548378.1 hypothetical protein F0145_06530 [Adhaeribacter rhizoryzae]
MSIKNNTFQDSNFTSNSNSTNYHLEAERHCLFKLNDLIAKIGEEQALDLANQYLRVSHQHSKWKEWSVHRYPLLTSYRNYLTGKNAPVEPWPSVFEKECTLYHPSSIRLGQQEDLNLAQFAEMIKGEKFVAVTTALRAITDEKERIQYKKENLCYGTFSGTFSKRHDQNLVKHSDLICIDFDQLGQRRDDIRTSLNALPITVMSFISPEGDGLRVLFEMDIHSFSQKVFYYHYATYFRKIYGLPPFKIDARYFHVSRACYLPHDPNVYINPLFLQP